MNSTHMKCTQHMTNCTIPLNKYESLPNRDYY